MVVRSRRFALRFSLSPCLQFLILSAIKFPRTIKPYPTNKNSPRPAATRCLQIFTKRHEDEWELLSTIGSGQAGKSSYALDTPKGVEFDASTARLYVADSGNRRVQVGIP